MAIGLGKMLQACCRWYPVLAAAFVHEFLPWVSMAVETLRRNVSTKVKSPHLNHNFAFRQ